MQTQTPAFSIEIYLAEDAAGEMPFRGEAPARYRHVGDTLELPTDELEDALEWTFELGNVGEIEAEPFGAWVASYRLRDRARSLSIGDVVVVNGEAGFVVDRCGFRPMTSAERAILAGA